MPTSIDTPAIIVVCWREAFQELLAICNLLGFERVIPPRGMASRIPHQLMIRNKCQNRVLWTLNSLYMHQSSSQVSGISVTASIPDWLTSEVPLDLQTVCLVIFEPRRDGYEQGNTVYGRVQTSSVASYRMQDVAGFRSHLRLSVGSIMNGIKSITVNRMTLIQANVSKCSTFRHALQVADKICKIRSVRIIQACHSLVQTARTCIFWIQAKAGARRPVFIFCNYDQSRPFPPPPLFPLSLPPLFPLSLPPLFPLSPPPLFPLPPPSLEFPRVSGSLVER